MSDFPKFEIGDVVTVSGYGGSAVIHNVEQDGVTPQGHPKWLYTVEFGAFSGADNGPASEVGYALKNAPMGRWAGVGRTLKKAQGIHHMFYQGRLESFWDQGDDIYEAAGITPQQEVAMMSQEEIIEALTEMGIECQI